MSLPQNSTNTALISVGFVLSETTMLRMLFSKWNLEVRTNLANMSLFSFQNAGLRKIYVVPELSNFFE